MGNPYEQENPYDNPYDELPDDNKIEPSENILQKAAKAATSFLSGSMSGGDMGYEMASGRNPFVDAAANAGMALTGPKNNASKFGDVGAQAESMRQSGVERATEGNPFGGFLLNIATDPRTFIGSAEVGKSAARASKPFAKNIGRMVSDKKALQFSDELEGAVEKTGSSLSKRMGGGIDAVQDFRGAGERISFDDIISKPQFSTKVSKLINKSDDLKLYDFDNLSLQESQDVINTLKSNLRQSLRNGDMVKSDEREIIRLLDELRQRQLSRFPEYEHVLSNYGEGVDAYNDVSGQIPKMLEGKENRIVRAAKEQSLKKTSPEAYKEYKGYKNTSKAVKIGGAGALAEVIRQIFGN